MGGGIFSAAAPLHAFIMDAIVPFASSASSLGGGKVVYAASASGGSISNSKVSISVTWDYGLLVSATYGYDSVYTTIAYPVYFAPGIENLYVTNANTGSLTYSSIYSLVITNITTSSLYVESRFKVSFILFAYD